MKRIIKTVTTGVVSLGIMSLASIAVLADSVTTTTCQVNVYGSTTCNVINGKTALGSNDMLFIAGVAFAFGIAFIVMSKVIASRLNYFKTK